MKVKCAQCQAWTEKKTPHVKRAAKRGMKLYCGRPCMALAFRVHRTGAELAEVLAKRKRQREEATKRYRAAHPERVKERARRWRAKNLDHIREYRLAHPEQKSKAFRKYYWRNRESMLARNRVYQTANREHLKEKSRDYRERNAERLRIYALEHRERHNANKAAFRLANLERERARALAHYHRTKAQNAEKIRQRARNRYARERDRILARSKLESKRRVKELHPSYLKVVARQYGFTSPSPQALGALKALIRVRRLVKERINGN